MPARYPEPQGQDGEHSGGRDGVVTAARLAFFAIWFAAAAYAIRRTWKPYRFLARPAGRSWRDVVPSGVAAQRQSGSLASVIARGTRADKSSPQYMWIVFDEQHLLVTRFGGFHDDPVLLEKPSASPVTMINQGSKTSVSFGRNVVSIGTTRAVARSLAAKLEERAWSVLTPDRASAAGWFPDPTFRHQLRYWNGVDWIDAVSDGQDESTDPLRD